MKLDKNGIRFRLLVSFVLLAVSIVLLLGLMQVSLIRPYYRNSKIQSTKVIAESLQEKLLSASGGQEDDVEDAYSETVDNDFCVVIFNSSGKEIYSADLLGEGCVFNNSAETDYSVDFHDAAAMIESLDESEGEYSIEVENITTGQDMLVYAEKISENLGTYYLFMNTPLEPVDSLISFFMSQYFYYTIVVTCAAFLFAVWISGKIAKPIIGMRKEAVKLYDADYRASFDGGSFSETRDLAETLNKATTELGKIEELRRDLMANVSHDIRTPLTNIRAYAEMIRDLSGDDKEKRNKHLNVIIRETEYMNTLINEMSELSKMQSGNDTLHRTNVDLSEKVAEIIELDGPIIERAGVILVTDMPDHLIIFADEVKIKEVIHNFLSNAIKHTDAGKHIYIRGSVLKDEETVRFEIQDEGDGIAKEDLDKIWDRYQKSSKSFSRNLKNTGLGLAIVKAILDQHNAEYGVESTLGKGSVFWFEMRETHEG